MVCEGQNCLYNIFTTFMVNFCVCHYLKIFVLSVVCLYVVKPSWTKLALI